MTKLQGCVLACAFACVQASCKGGDRIELGPAAARATPSAGAALPGASVPVASAPSTIASAAPRASAPLLASSAAPESPEKRDSARFAVIGDFGADTPDEARVASLVKSWKPDFVVTMGDNNYPTGEASTIDKNIGKYYAEFIGNYRGSFGPGSKTNRFWPSAGNHDWGSGLGPYIDYFTLPGNERYYDADLGIVHLFAVDSDPHEPDGVSSDSVQAKWLKDKLSRSKSCYDIVFFHHPPYSSARHGSSEYMRWPFRDWGAEVVMAGHDHTYERLVTDRIPYFVNGLGGGSKYPFQNATLPETQARYNDDYGAMLVNANKTGITYEFYSADGTKRDSLMLPAQNGCGK